MLPTSAAWQVDLWSFDNLTFTRDRVKIEARYFKRVLLSFHQVHQRFLTKAPGSKGHCPACKTEEAAGTGSIMHETILPSTSLASRRLRALRLGSSDVAAQALCRRSSRSGRRSRVLGFEGAIHLSRAAMRQKSAYSVQSTQARKPRVAYPTIKLLLIHVNRHESYKTFLF